MQQTDRPLNQWKGHEFTTDVSPAAGGQLDLLAAIIRWAEHEQVGYIHTVDFNYDHDSLRAYVTYEN